MELSKLNLSDCGNHKNILEQFIKYKRSQGFSYKKSVLIPYVGICKYLSQYYEEKPVITKEIVDNFFDNYISSDSAANTIHNYKCAFRQLALFLKQSGHKNIYVLPAKQKKIPNTFVPYIFTYEEFVAILKAIARGKHFRNNESRIFYITFFVILYATGMRVNEVLSLKMEDIDFDNKIFTVLNAKGNTAKLIPYNNSLAYWLDRYISTLNNKNQVYLFNRNTKSSPGILNKFHFEILPEAGIDIHNSGRYKRLHDFRHTFATHALDKMVKSGKDPFCALPYLSTYLGHKDIKSTEIYLRLTEEHFKEITEAGHYMYKGIMGEDND